MRNNYSYFFHFCIYIRWWMFTKHIVVIISWCCCCLVAQSYQTLCNPMDCSMPGFRVLYCLPNFAQNMSIESMMLSNHLTYGSQIIILYTLNLYSAVYRRLRFNPWVRKIPWRKKYQPAPVVLPGKSHGQKSLVGYSPWGRRRVGHNVATKWQHVNHISVKLEGKKMLFPKWQQTKLSQNKKISSVF